MQWPPAWPPHPPAAFGGSHRAYYAWRWPLLRRPLRRILVESDVTDLEIATYPGPASPGTSSCGSGSSGPQDMEGVEAAAGGQQQQQQPSQQAGQQQAGAVGVAWEHSVVQQATLAPAGGLLAFTELSATRMGALESWVVVADARTGRRVCAVRLADPHPPFYYYWLPCGTRLLFMR